MEKLERRTFDLMLLDLMLPGLNGLEVCQRVRTAARTATLPLLILTEKSSEADEVLGLQMGAEDYVTKPFSPLKLTARVKTLLRRTTDQKHYEPGGRLAGRV